MRRLSVQPRPDWEARLGEIGFQHVRMDGEVHWDEGTAYAFDAARAHEMIEAPVAELHGLCREAVERVVGSDELMARFEIPRATWGIVRASWRADEPELLGRMDLLPAADGSGPLKLLEYNADTPGLLVEAADAQAQWLEDGLASGALPPGTGQINRLHDALVARLREIFAPDTDVHFTCFEGFHEDYATTELVAYAARDAGLGAHFVPTNRIGLSEGGQFTDAEDRVIGALFKLYPWADMLRDDFAEAIPGAGCAFLEPAWKALVENKALLAVLWEMFEGHPNLLPTRFEDDLGIDGRGGLAGFERGTVLKPILSRQGSGITMLDAHGIVLEASRDRGHDGGQDRGRPPKTRIAQALHEGPVRDGWRPVIGAWVVGRHCAGIGVVEDCSRITQASCRFVPHVLRAP